MCAIDKIGIFPAELVFFKKFLLKDDFLIYEQELLQFKEHNAHEFMRVNFKVYVTKNKRFQS